MKVLRQASGLPLGLLARRVASRLVSKALTLARARRDARRGTYLDGERAFVPLRFAPTEPTHDEAALLADLAQKYAAHEFDLLGSGWVHVPAPERVGGSRGSGSAFDICDLVPPGCAAESRRIRALIQDTYVPIDWQLDFKSNHRWSERTWYAHIAYGHLPGVDVKVPWELARLQHVPVLVLAARSAAPDQAERWRTEATSQMLDFVAANPPRFGVNWRTAMDVGIRAANIAIAMDLLVQDGIDGPWRGVLARSLEEHARHIADNLEWSERARGNHYLANVAGLAWCASHLEPSPQSVAWLGWAAQELEVETGRQFLDDGANFEASVCYHRLSAEMVAWTAACLSSLSMHSLRAADPGLAPKSPPLREPPAPRVERLRKELAGMAAFTRWATKPTGEVAQIGDNDSGRFFRLPGEFEGLTEQPLRHDETIDVLRCLCGEAPRTLAGRLAGGLARFSGTVPPPSPMPSFGVLGTADSWPDSRGDTATEWVFGDGCWDRLETAAFPSFGLYVWRSERVWMAVRCGPVGQGGLGGHAHNDALHIELTVDGRSWIADPGSGVYTPDPKIRNAYRSAAAHFVPLPGGASSTHEARSAGSNGDRLGAIVSVGEPRSREPSSLGHGLFRLGDCGARCHRFGPEGFVGSHDGFGARMWRVLDLLPNGVRVQDLWEGGEASPVPALGPDRVWRPIAFSAGYGRFEP